MEQELLLKGLFRKKNDLTNEHDRLQKSLYKDIEDMDCVHLSSVVTQICSVSDRLSLINEIIEDMCFK